MIVKKKASKASKPVVSAASRKRPPQRVEQLVIECERGTNTNVDLAPGKPAYFDDRLLLLINTDAVRRPDAAWPIGLPPVIMKALLVLKELFGLVRVTTIVSTGQRFYLSPSASAPEGLTAGERSKLNDLVMPLSPGELPAFIPGPVPDAAAIEMASRVELIFANPAKVEGAAQFLLFVPNIQRVERPACGYAMAPNTAPPPREETPGRKRSGRTIIRVASYEPDWWQAFTGWAAATFGAPDKPINNIAVLDSGADADHPSFRIKNSTNLATSAISAIEFPADSNFPYLRPDTYGHGTHVCSIIAGRHITGVMVPTPAGSEAPMPTGALPSATILSFRIFEGATVSMQKFKTALFAIRYHYPLIKVINLSIWMIDRPDKDLLDEFAKLETLKIVICACAGNRFGEPGQNYFADSNYRVLFPARLNNILSVGGAHREAGRAFFSRFSTWGTRGWDGNDYYAMDEGKFPLVDILAPGRMIWGAMTGNFSTDMGSETSSDPNIVKRAGAKFAYLNGTSMATPLVTSAIAYLRSKTDWAAVPATQIRRVISKCVTAGNSVAPNVSRAEFEGSGVLDFSEVAAWAAKTPDQL